MGKKIQLPKQEEFVKVYFSTEKTNVAKYFGVSLPTISRWAKNLGISKYEMRDTSTPLSSIQKELIEGSMLGDGCISARKQNYNCYYYETHCDKQTDYLIWKQKLLHPIAASKLYKYIRPKGHKETSFHTSCHPELTEYEGKWYLRKNGNYVHKSTGQRIKTVPPDLILNPFKLAIWFFDDGKNMLYKRGLTLATNAFQFDECWLLVDKLKEMGIKNCKVITWRDKEPTIYIGSWAKRDEHQSSCLTFIDMIKYHLPCECLRYKVDLSRYKVPTRHGRGNLPNS